MGRVTKEVPLLLAFLPTSRWHPVIQARARIITEQYLPQGRTLDQLDEFLEASVLFNSNLGELVISCFLPSPEILSVVNRHGRRVLFPEPNERPLQGSHHRLEESKDKGRAVELAEASV